MAASTTAYSAPFPPLTLRERQAPVLRPLQGNALSEHDPGTT